MSSAERAEAIASKHDGWMRALVRRALDGCSNCNERYTCASVILGSGGYEGDPVKLVYDTLLGPGTCGPVPSYLANEVAKFARTNCARCDKLNICVAQLHVRAYGWEGSPEDEHRDADAVMRLMLSDRFPSTVQGLLDNLGMTTVKLQGACLKAFASCRCRHLIGR